MNYEQLLQQVEFLISKYMRKHADPRLVFHNFAYTTNKVAVASRIADHEQLDEQNRFILLTATWFSDLGYYKNPKDPDLTGVHLADKFLKDLGIEPADLESIKSCLLAPASFQPAGSKPAEALCDTATFIYGMPEFKAYSKLWRTEEALLSEKEFDAANWIGRMIIRMEQHHFYTDYCKTVLQPTKEKNLKKLRKIQPMPILPAASLDATFSSRPEEVKPAKDKQQSKGDLPDRTIETMFRTTSANSQRLSSQADAKAHIMISVNTIIVSLILGIVVRKIDSYKALAIPTGLLLAVNLTTIIFAILATRPNVKKITFSGSTLEPEKTNMLFFGNFFSLHFDEYSEHMLHLMTDKKQLYLQLLRNLYEQGVVLAKKYRMLKISYNVFMFGLVISVIAFLIASKYFDAV